MRGSRTGEVVRAGVRAHGAGARGLNVRPGCRRHLSRLPPTIPPSLPRGRCCPGEPGLAIPGAGVASPRITVAASDEQRGRRAHADEADARGRVLLPGGLEQRRRGRRRRVRLLVAESGLVRRDGRSKFSAAAMLLAGGRAASRPSPAARAAAGLGRGGRHLSHLPTARAEAGGRRARRKRGGRGECTAGGDREADVAICGRNERVRCQWGPVADLGSNRAVFSLSFPARYGAVLHLPERSAGHAQGLQVRRTSAAAAPAAFSGFPAQRPDPAASSRRARLSRRAAAPSSTSTTTAQAAAVSVHTAGAGTLPACSPLDRSYVLAARRPRRRPETQAEKLENCHTDGRAPGTPSPAGAVWRRSPSLTPPGRRKASSHAAARCAGRRVRFFPDLDATPPGFATGRAKKVL